MKTKRLEIRVLSFILAFILLLGGFGSEAFAEEESKNIQKIQMTGNGDVKLIDENINDISKEENVFEGIKKEEGENVVDIHEDNKHELIESRQEFTERKEETEISQEETEISQEETEISQEETEISQDETEVREEKVEEKVEENKTGSLKVEDEEALVQNEEKLETSDKDSLSNNLATNKASYTSNNVTAAEYSNHKMTVSTNRKINDSMYFYTMMGGRVVFCVEPGVLNDFSGYTSSGSNQYIDKAIKNIDGLSERLGLIKYFSYDKAAYKNKEARSFTQMMIWREIYRANIKKYGSFRSSNYGIKKELPFYNMYSNSTINQKFIDWEKRVLKLVNNALIANPNIPKTISLLPGESKTFTDSTGALSKLSFKENNLKSYTDSNGIKYVINGNKITITAPLSAGGKSSTATMKVSTISSDDIGGKNLFYYVPNKIKQALAWLNQVDPLRIALNVNVEKLGILRFWKIESISREKIKDLPAQFELLTRDSAGKYISVGLTGRGMKEDGQYQQYRYNPNSTQKTIWLNAFPEAEGRIEIINLPAGEYWIKETVAPAGYKLEKTWLKFDVKGGQAVFKSFPNEKFGSLTVHKVSKRTKEHLTGASFEVRDSSGNLVRFTGGQNSGYTYNPDYPGAYARVWVGNESPMKGILKLGALPKGTYRLKELSAPTGYSLSTESLEVIVDGNNINKTFENEDKPSTLRFWKLDDNGNLIKDLPAQFRLLDSNKNPVTVTGLGEFESGSGGYIYQRYKYNPDSTQTTIWLNPASSPNSDGKVEVIGLPAGRYYIEELIAPIGFEKDPDYTVFNLSPGGTSLERIVNLKRGAILITKVDARTGDKLMGASFELRDSNGNIVKFTGGQNSGYSYNPNYPGAYSVIWVGREGDLQGKMLIKNLPNGSYTLKELSAPAGYFIEEATVNITIDGSRFNKEIKNEPTHFTLRKIDSISRQLITTGQGSFSVKDAQGNTVKFLGGWDTGYRYYDGDSTDAKELVLSNSDGLINIYGLPAGEYSITEEKAPEFYEKSTEVLKFTIENTLTANFENEQVKPEIVFSKVDPQGNYVEGAKLAIVEKLNDGTEKVIHSFTTTNKPYKYMGLTRGKTYFLKEQEVPANFLKTDDVKFTVRDSLNSVNFVKMVDEHRPLISTVLLTDDKLKEVHKLEGIVLSDEVTLENLAVGKEYTLTMNIMANGTKIDTAVTKKVFTANNENMTLQMPVTIDLSKYQDDITKLVANQVLEVDGRIVAEHKDLLDKEQTVIVKYPEIKTKFTDIEGKKYIYGKYKVKLIDNVSYSDLIVGEEYKLSMRIAIKGSNPQEFIKSADGKDLLVEHVFTPTTKDGVEKVEVEVDLSTLQGREIVSFEKLFYKGLDIALHEDIEDLDQTIKIEPLVMPHTGSLNLSHRLKLSTIMIILAFAIKVIKESKKKILRGNNEKNN